MHRCTNKWVLSLVCYIKAVKQFNGYETKGTGRMLFNRKQKQDPRTNQLNQGVESIKIIANFK